MDCVTDSSFQRHSNPAFQHDGNRTNGVCALDEKNAITVRHAQIQYKDVLGALVSGAAPKTNVVLKDFNMSVQKGHIYGLLGASGCGKTSLLRALIGQIDLTAGEIRVLGHKPKTPESGIPGTTIGYMPQELSLIEEFTIKESLLFYGQLEGMNSNDIYSRCNYLVKLLDLPEANRIIASLSGGQKRRVSFAIALIHSPPILILDEPTVGVDPLLRESVWEYLTKLASTSKTTILITTHYVEEARQADTVGLMRHGKLMAEQSPKSLMECLQCSGLEDVLVKLCVLQSTKETSITYVNNETTLPGIQTVLDDDIVSSKESAFSRKHVPAFKRIQVLSWKNTLSYIRQPVFLIFVLIFPTLWMTLFYFSYGRTPSDIKISVFNQETDCFSDFPWSNQYRNSTNCLMPRFFSCKVLKGLKENRITSVPFESERAAENSIRRGKAWGYVIFPKNFTNALLERAVYNPSHDVDNTVLDMGSIQVRMDMSDQVVSNLVKFQIVQALKEVLEDVNAVCHNFRHMKDMPIQYKTPIYGGSETNIIDTVAPGIITSLCLLNPLTAAIGTLLPERMSGTLERGLVAGVRMGEVVLSHFIVCLISSCSAIGILLVIAYILFGLTMNGSIWTLVVILFPLQVYGLLLGYFIAFLCDSVTGALILGTGIYFGYCYTCGAFWPIEGVYPFIRPFCRILPLTLPTQALRFIAVRGWSLYNWDVQLSVISVVIWSCITFVLLVLILRLKR